MSLFEKIEQASSAFPIRGKHVSLTAVKLITNTDENDTLVEQRTCLVYHNRTPLLEGQIFIVTDHTCNQSTLYVIPAPDFWIPRAKIEAGVLKLCAESCPIYTATCKADEAERTCRAWYREHYHPKTLHTMSNTWGDRNGRTRVCDEFIRREIDSAKDLGLDVVQIDDGWQTGVPAPMDADGNRFFDENFWEVKQEVFPNGLAPLAAYAKERGVALGLWFAPHSSGLFEYFERDLSLLQKAYHDWHVRCFKLDMIHLPSQAHCDRMTALLEQICRLEGASVELDVTADNRLGYLASAPFGTIFVENRYTAWGNYYPHRTLRNEWMLSRYIPTAKLQFELINPALCHEKYSDTDPFRHALYDADYLFATVMLSNPLFWMETQFLPEKSREQLKEIIAKWKCHREELTFADVSPIGEEPCGASLTGFLAETSDAYHILLFREVTDRQDMTVTLPSFVKNVELIAQNTPTQISTGDNTLTATFSQPRSYVWLKVEKI